MIPCRETIGGDPAVRGYRCAQPPAKFGFFPAGKELSEDSCQFSVFRFQMSARSGRGAWKGARMAREVMLPAGHHLNLAGALSEAKPPEIDAKPDVSGGIILVHG